jgi:hypothetical protein
MIRSRTKKERNDQTSERRKRAITRLGIAGTSSNKLKQPILAVNRRIAGAMNAFAGQPIAKTSHGLADRPHHFRQPVAEQDENNERDDQ